MSNASQVSRLWLDQWTDYPSVRDIHVQCITGQQVVVRQWTDYPSVRDIHVQCITGQQVVVRQWTDYPSVRDVHASQVSRLWEQQWTSLSAS